MQPSVPTMHPCLLAIGSNYSILMVNSNFYTTQKVGGAEAGWLTHNDN